MREPEMEMFTFGSLGKFRMTSDVGFALTTLR